MAHARELAAAAESSLDVDPERSIYLAMAAVDETRSQDGTVLPEAEAALHDAVTAARAVMTIPAVGDYVAWGRGQFAITGAANPAAVQIRDPSTGDVLRDFTLNSGSVTDLAFTANGLRLLTASSSGLLQVWDPKAASLVATVRGIGAATGISSNSTSVAASWPRENTVRVADIHTGRTTATLRHTPADSTALSPNGAAIAVAAETTTVFDLTTSDARYAPLTRRYGAGSVTWSPDGRYLATMSIAGPDVWDAASGRHLYALPDSPWVEAAVWSADSSRLVTSGSEPKITVWRVGPNGPREQMQLSSTETVGGGVGALAISSNGARVAATSVDEDVVKVWDISTSGDREWANIPTVTSFGDVAFMPDGSQVVVAGPHGRVRTWDIASGEPVGPAIGPRVDEHAFDLSSDGRWLTGLDATSTVWNTSTGQATGTAGLPSEPGSSNFNPEGTLIVVNDVHTGHGTTVVDRHGQVVARLPDQPGYTTSTAHFSPDGQLIATIGAKVDSGSLITVWDWRAQEVAQTIETPYAEGLAFDPEGMRLATAWGMLSVWDLQSGRVAMTLKATLSSSETQCSAPTGVGWSRLPATAPSGCTTRRLVFSRWLCRTARGSQSLVSLSAPMERSWHRRVRCRESPGFGHTTSTT